jgi:ABC-type multidrug transport system fused ATPase/permease subunit
MNVLSGTMSVGMFVTNLKMVEHSGHAFTSIFHIMVDMQRTYPAVMNLFELLNLETDVVDRMTIFAGKEKKAVAKAEGLLTRMSTGDDTRIGIAEDLIPIEINLYDGFAFDGETQSTLNFKGNIHITQGQMLAIVGGIGAGKNTLLQLISGRRLPDLSKCNNYDRHGIFVPSHLRIASVCPKPIFYSGTLLENITFGSTDPKPSDIERVRTIFQKLSMSEEVLSYLDLEDNWDTIFSQAQRKLLNIARALFFNAEVTCYHAPLAELDPFHMPLVMQVLHEHIKEKGLGLDDDLFHRRPRTIFLTSSNPVAVLEADHIYMVDRNNGISMLTNEMAADELKKSFTERGNTHRQSMLRGGEGIETPTSRSESAMSISPARSKSFQHSYSSLTMVDKRQRRIAETHRLMESPEKIKEDR